MNIVMILPSLISNHKIIESQLLAEPLMADNLESSECQMYNQSSGQIFVEISTHSNRELLLNSNDDCRYSAKSLSVLIKGHGWFLQK
jgi:hypothetical protein